MHNTGLRNFPYSRRDGQCNTVLLFLFKCFLDRFNTHYSGGASATASQRLRNLLNIETSVSFVASLFYSFFLQKIDDGRITLTQITPYRYLDWAITTPMLLLVLMMFLQTPVHLPTFLTAVALNYGMLASGYLGETDQISKLSGSAIGFLFFAALIGLLLYTYSSGFTRVDTLIFSIFTLVWSLYGMVYWLDEKNKNLAYNALDVIAKVFFGLFIWVYYSNVFN